MGERIEQIGSGECSITVEAYRGKVHVTVLGEEAQGIVLDSPVALVNALLRLCTHAQLGEVVVPRRAGEWVPEPADPDGEASRYMFGDGEGVGTVRLQADGTWTAWWLDGWQWTCKPRHPTRAEAEAAVDERLRADGVVLP